MKLTKVSGLNIFESEDGKTRVVRLYGPMNTQANILRDTGFEFASLEETLSIIANNPKKDFNNIKVRTSTEAVCVSNSKAPVYVRDKSPALDIYASDPATMPKAGYELTDRQIMQNKRFGTPNFYIDEDLVKEVQPELISRAASGFSMMFLFEDRPNVLNDRASSFFNSIFGKELVKDNFYSFRTKGIRGARIAVLNPMYVQQVSQSDYGLIRLVSAKRVNDLISIDATSLDYADQTHLALGIKR